MCMCTCRYLGVWGGAPVDLRGGQELGDVGLAGGAGLDNLALAQRPPGMLGAVLHNPLALQHVPAPLMTSFPTAASPHTKQALQD